DNLGEALVRTAEFIINEDLSNRYEVFSIDYSMIKNMDTVRSSLEEAVDNFVKKNYKVIVFVDIFGGSPSNVAFTLSKQENVDIISGVNLPMVLYAFDKVDSSIDLMDMVQGAVESAKNNINSAKKLLVVKEKND
ncbi:MAG: hypothetical protein R6W70_04225, partial [bacterium]